MEPLDVSTLADGSLLLVDSAPIIYVLEGHRTLAPRFRPLFDRQADGEFSFAVTTITIAEVLTGPLRVGDEALAERAARLRTHARLRLPDAVQAASAIAVNADALVTHDRDFSKLTALRVLA
jgi:predicted nucleic acid-binding protein